MIGSIVAIALVALIAYLWSSRGFFSALLNMACVIAAGAIAFSLWEVAAMLLLGSVNSGLVQSIAWGATLGLLFGVSLALLRLLVDKFVPANAPTDTVPDFVGGAVCGAVSGVITVGMVFIAVSYMSVPAGFLWYSPVGYSEDESSSLVRRSNLILPVDRITATLYGRLSVGGLRPLVGEPMADVRPAVSESGHALRNPLREGYANKIFLSPGDFSVVAEYTVGRDAEGDDRSLDRLTRDFLGGARGQEFRNLDGSSPDPDSYIQGVVVSFDSGAKERESATVVVGPGQVYLVAKTPTGAKTFHPLAMVSQAQVSEQRLGRWRFDSPDFFVASMGGAAQVPMAFEFLVPRSATPTSIVVKGVRVRLDGAGGSPAAYASFSDRDAAIRSTRGPFDVRLAAGRAAPEGPEVVADPVAFNFGLPNRMQINKGNSRGLQIDDENQIYGGSATFPTEELANRGLDRSLIVRSYRVPANTSMAQIIMDLRNPEYGLLSDRASGAPSGPIELVDRNGLTYPAIGYFYQDRGGVQMRFEPTQPLRSIGDLPTRLSSSRTDQRLWLYFLPTEGAQITELRIGGQTVKRFTGGGLSVP